MATEPQHEEPPVELDLDTGPFELQAIECLPLTKEEREIVREVIDEARRERATAATTA